MRSFMTICRLHRCQHSFAQDNSGATAIEYALIACGVSIAIVGGLTSLGTQIMVAFYEKLNNLF
jgi:Flp pilus assembly pilin Flp